LLARLFDGRCDAFAGSRIFRTLVLVGAFRCRE
jgi:hypothetical protein